MRAAIVGIAGPTLSADEIALFAEAPPAGIILFARNVETPDQLATLIAAMPGTAVLIDQEGGRVARLRPPHWRAHPPAAAHATPRAAWLTGALIGLDCAALGIDIVCAPVLDRPVPGAHDVIGDRAFATTDHARAMADGLLAAGIQPVGKHAPGHGRAGVDSHAGLPAVHGPIDDDLAPFHALRSLPWMMTAHILYTALDADRPGTLSPIVVRLIREQIGFGGVLVTDDLAMGALSGPPGARTTAALAAGCDLALHCTGVLADTAEVLRAAGPVGAETQARLAAARAMAAARRIPLDAMALAAEREALV